MVVSIKTMGHMGQSSWSWLTNSRYREYRVLEGSSGGPDLVLLLRSPGVFSESPMYMYAATGWLTQLYAVKVRGVLTHAYLGVLQHVFEDTMSGDFSWIAIRSHGVETCKRFVRFCLVGRSPKVHVREAQLASELRASQRDSPSDQNEVEGVRLPLWPVRNGTKPNFHITRNHPW